MSSVFCYILVLLSLNFVHLNGQTCTSGRCEAFIAPSNDCQLLNIDIPDDGTQVYKSTLI